MKYRYRQEGDDRLAERKFRPDCRKRRVRRDGAMMMAGIGNLARVVAVIGGADQALPGMADINRRLGRLGQLRPAEQDREDQEKMQNAAHAAP